MSGVFFSHIYVVDSHRDSVFPYFGKRGVTVIVVKVMGTSQLTVIVKLRSPLLMEVS